MNILLFWALDLLFLDKPRLWVVEGILILTSGADQYSMKDIVCLVWTANLAKSCNRIYVWRFDLPVAIFLKFSDLLLDCSHQQKTILLSNTRRYFTGFGATLCYFSNFTLFGSIWMHFFSCKILFLNCAQMRPSEHKWASVVKTIKRSRK